MPIKQLNGVDYHFAEHGTGPALLLLHGFTGSAENWHPFKQQLGLKYHLVAPDILGHGRTAAPVDPVRYQMAQVAADIISLLDQLEVEKTNLLGYSMGGRLGLFLTLNYPDRFDKLIIESSSPGLVTAAERATRRQTDEALAVRLERDGIEAFVDFWQGLSLWASQATMPAAKHAAQRQQRLDNRPQGLACSLRGMGTGAQPSLWDRLGELDRPVLLLNGALDKKYVTINQKMVSLLPQSTMLTFAEVGHNVHLEAPARFAKVVLDWLDGRDARE